MPTYAVLLNPGHNRVYFKVSRSLALLELGQAAAKMACSPENLREEVLGAVDYLLFDTKSRLGEGDMLILSRLSFVYGIFEWAGGALVPQEKNPSYYFESDDITTILKYNGKTNELFTRMLLNIAIFQSDFKLTDELSVLDPLCGKGTTLFEGLLCGHNVYGVEIDEKLLHEAYIFLKKYLENARFKHSVHQERQGMKGYRAQRYELKLSGLKAEAKTKTPGSAAGRNSLEAQLVAADTRDMGLLFKKNSFHAAVGDLPYGVQHGSRREKTDRQESRNAMPMLADALPGWYKVLKPGGTLALAWNLFLIERREMEEALEKAGFSLTMPKGSEAFVHRVDQAIRRDLIIGKKL
jgi:SAM-dependent methyltransferase